MIHRIDYAINHATHQMNAVPATARPSAPAASETNPFQSVLATTSAPDLKQALPKATITAVITKSAAPAVALTAPVYEQGATVSNPDGSTSPLNHFELADGATAANIAAKLGGVVDQSILGGFSVGQRNIKVPGSSNLINAGIAAQLFAEYGDKPGSIAWQTINRDLGRDPMST